MADTPPVSPYRCVLCGYMVELDDAMVPSLATARCICIRCWARETADEHPTTDEERKRLEQALTDAEDNLQ